MLLGPTVIGIHFGNGSGVGNSTGFFLFNFTQPTSSINLGIGSSSDAVLYASGGAVPEPATWAMMLLGFAGIGFAIRRWRQLKPLRIA
jgi:PEP-CTERM motif